MSDSIISPDGEFMWTGSEWIPAPPQKNIEISDSVVMGDVVSNTNIITGEKKDIRSYLQTAIDSIYNNDLDNALSVINLAKVENYDEFISLITDEYNTDICDAFLYDLTRYWTKHLKGVSPISELTTWSQKELDLYSNHIEEIKVKGNRVFDLNPEEQDALMIFGQIGIKFRHTSIAKVDGIEMAIWASNKLKNINPEWSNEIVKGHSEREYGYSSTVRFFAGIGGILAFVGFILFFALVIAIMIN
tara:strand:+ start:168 stop:905 length:738 start_codon:yes stop_codon:yes gene_type:complete